MGSRYIANKIEDKIEPCGRPCLSLYRLDIVVFILMEKVLVDIAFKPFKDSIFNSYLIESCQ